MRPARAGAIALTALVVILGAGVAGGFIYRENKAAPAPPAHDSVVALEAAVGICSAPL